jgi:diguanylate cyclase (GGDEF)-like protein
MAMDAIIVIHSALIAIAAIIAIVLAVAWREFGRPDHARTWSVAFALASLMWAIELAQRLKGPVLQAPGTAMLAIAGFATVLNTIAFRERVGLPPRYAPLLGLATAQALLTIALRLSHIGPCISVAPLHVLNAAMLWMASRTLTGRRRGERVAEKLAATVLRLIALTSLALVAMILASAAGLLQVNLLILNTQGLLALPATISGIGFFTIFLLAADLSDQTRRLAASDMLTGLLNRRGFEEAARAIFGSARRHGRSLAVAVLDIDRFKQVNDSYGHPAGDAVLRAFARCLRDNVARRDLVARTGGEEFAVIMADVDAEAALCAADALREKIGALIIDGGGVPIRITTSLGLAAYCPGEDLATVLARADRALYQSKSLGRNRATLAEAREDVMAGADPT